MAFQPNKRARFLGPSTTKEEALKATLRAEILRELRSDGRFRDELRADILALPAWTEFVDVTANLSSDVARRLGATASEMLAVQEKLAEADGRGVAVETKVFQNSRYFVCARLLSDGMVELSIRNISRDARHDWREFQRIKNELVGPEREAVEIYPAESRLVDTANQFYVFVLPENVRVPCGFDMRAVCRHSPEDGTVQRDWEPGQEPPDARSISANDAVAQLLTEVKQV